MAAQKTRVRGPIIESNGKVAVVSVPGEAKDIDYTKTGVRMRARRQQLGMSLNQTAKKIGCTATTVKRWEEGEIKSLKTTRLKEIAAALNTTPEELTGATEPTLVLPSGVKIAPATRRVPNAQTGKPVQMPSNIKADLALKFKGDSMINARIFDGDTVYIKRQPDVKNGEIAAVMLDDKITLRRIYKYDGRIELRPENPTYPPVNFEGAEIADLKIIGKPVAFMGKIK